MNKRYFKLIVALFLLGYAANSSAQLSGTNCFLQGSFLEIGVLRNGAFGASGIPAGYHPHLSGTGIPPAGGNLAEVYDYGLDGWAVGAPPYMGDYTYPGSPFEGWGLQVNVGRTHAFVPGTFNSAAGGSLTGAISAVGGYINAGGRAICNWNGTASGGGMLVRQETRVDTMASWVVITTVMTNTTAAAMPGVYYLRSCDPDNNQTWAGGGFPTNNQIMYQNDIQHRVLVRATSSTGPASYFGLGTRDCRAKVFIYNQWSMSTAVDFADMYNQTVPAASAGPYFYDFVNHPGDIGIGLVYNIGTIAPGDSAIVSYAYVFNNDAGLDQAFPHPQLVVNGTPFPVVAPPQPNYDTFDVCLYPGMTTLPVNINFGSDKNWSWSKWTWSPGTGLATTTGVVNTINVGSLPPVITYTITGTDSAFGMSSCNNKVFYLTILTCNGAESSDACVGDTIFFNAPGDSIAATYRWYGPAPSTAVFAVTQSTYKYPATMADAGLYKVIKTVAGIPDTSETTVSVFALPVLAVTSTQANCKPVVNPLNLYCNPDSVCTDFDWTGPLGFTSTMQNPMIAPFDSSMAGYYVVEATSTHGCKNKDSVEVKPGPWAKYLFDRMPGCPNDSVMFTDYSWNGSTYEWTFGDGFTSFDRNPLHIYTAGHKPYTVKLTVRSANGCTDDTTLTVDVSHGVTADFNFADDTICNITEQGIIIDASTSFDVTTPGQPIASWDWDLGDGTTESNATGSPANHTYPFEGPFTVRLKVTDALGCVDSIKKEILVLQPYIRALSDTTFCLTQPLQLFADAYTNKPGIEGLDDYSYAWTGAGIGNLSATTGNMPTFTGVGVFVYTITATLAGEGCQGTHQMTLNSTLPKQLTQVTKDVTILYGSSIQLNSDSEFLYTWTPNDGSLDNPNINNPIATPTVTTTYTVYGMDFYGCRDTAWVTVRVDSSKTEFIPTAFTPNGDGLNDEFRLIGSAFHNMLEFRIYNRWGEQIFYSTTLDHGWDGTYQGQKMDMGVYYYTVICARPGHPTNKVIKGEVTLIR